MNICIVTPAPPRSQKGNRVTALRWLRILRELGHRGVITQEYRRRRCDILVALHARRSHPSIKRFAEARPDAPLLVALTGTDLYGDLATSEDARESLDLATRLIVLQGSGVEAIPANLRGKARVIYQSVVPLGKSGSPRRDVFEVCVLGHLREVKDPFRTALAVRSLPSSSRVHVTHVGAALTSEMDRRAREESVANPRYQWVEEIPRRRALRTLARSRLLVLTSRMEGGANVISEAIAVGVPIISSRIPGSVGLLGVDYPGYFPPGDTDALAQLLDRAENDAEFYESLKSACARLAPLVDPARERETWRRLLLEVT